MNKINEILELEQEVQGIIRDCYINKAFICSMKNSIINGSDYISARDGLLRSALEVTSIDSIATHFPADMEKPLSEFVGTQSQIDAEKERRLAFVDADIANIRKATNELVSQIHGKCYALIIDDTPNELMAASKVIYNYAYEKGHSEGYNSVAQYYDDYVMFLSTSIEAIETDNRLRDQKEIDAEFGM